jgi:hypothetical protein
MTPSRYLVIQCGGAWVVRSGNRTFGPFSDHVDAIGAAIDFAGTDGKARRPAKVLVQEDGRTLRTAWIYGSDPYPSTPGNPANGRSNGTYRFTPSHIPPRANSPGVAIVGP